MKKLLPTSLWAVSFYGEIDAIELPEGLDFQILGAVTKDSIDFDAEPFVQKKGYGYEWYQNYVDRDSIDLTTPQESFYSLLQANGLYFENPMPQPLIEDYSDETTDKEIELYERYENSLVKKLLILQHI